MYCITNRRNKKGKSKKQIPNYASNHKPQTSNMLTVLHPWHGAHYGSKAPEIVNAVIEIPQGSRAKYEVDKETGLLKLDRVIYSSFHYPVNYGFIPQTLGQDNDPLDILVICSQSIQSLCLVEASVIGNMQMIDQGQMDDKIIAVAAKDPSVNHIKSVDELPPHFTAELKNYFEQYKVLENKKVEIDNFQDKLTAMKIINDAINFYKEHFKK
jgi:inorganic pyrophosphatase